jgi:hypothetical protein
MTQACLVLFTYRIWIPKPRFVTSWRICLMNQEDALLSHHGDGHIVDSWTSTREKLPNASTISRL